MNRQVEWKGLAAWLVVCALSAALGAIASVEARSFYVQLQQPEWAPPGWVFGPVWTLLYTMMALSAWLVWRRMCWGKRPALSLFLLQLVPNTLWSWLFFKWHLGLAALIDVLLLNALVAITIVLFWKQQRLAALLLVPYQCWILFAACLNWAVWQLNPVALGG